MKTSKKQKENRITLNHKIPHDLHKTNKDNKKQIIATDGHGFPRISTEELRVDSRK